MLFRVLIALALSCTVSGADRASLEREVIFAEHAGDGVEDVEIRRCQQRAAAREASVDDYWRLGAAFVAKARRTHDDGYFKLAEAVARVAEAEVGLSAELRLLRGHTRHMLHRFAEAEHDARILAAERGAADDYGLLSDVLMEQGQLAAAIEALETMSRLKPGSEAYARIAHMRWLKGDDTGAIAAMRAAWCAVDRRDVEKRAWVLTQMANYELRAGNLASARSSAEQALVLIPEYSPAWFALARACVAQEKIEEAAASLSRAVELNPLPEYLWWLADVLRGLGRSAQAVAVEERLRHAGEGADPRTLALFLATRERDVNVALRLARAELEARGDVFTHDAMAWCSARAGNLEAAEEAMRDALAEGTNDARLFVHAGAIARMRGEQAKALSYFSKAHARRATLTPSERALLGSDARGATGGPASNAED